MRGAKPTRTKKDYELVNSLTAEAEDATKSHILDNVETWKQILGEIPQISYDKYNAYADAINSIANSDYFHDRGDFQYDNTISDFLNPNAAAIVAEAGNAVKRSNPLRGGYGLDVDMTTSKTNKYNELFNEAKNDWQSDYDYNYNVWNNDNNYEQSKLDYKRAMDSNRLDMLKSLADYEQAMNDANMSTYSEAQKSMMDMLTQNGLTWADFGGNPFSATNNNNTNMYTNNLGV